MKKFKVAVIVGSLHHDSINLKLAHGIAKLAEGKFETEFLTISDLPLFNEDLEKDVPVSVKRFKSDVEKADAVLFVTPEYNRSIPGSLKNAIDWASRPYGSNSFKGKPTAMCGTSGGAIGSACAQNSLKPILIYLETILMGSPEVYFQFKDGVIDSDGKINDEKSKKFLQGFVDSFASWIAAYSK